MSLREFRRELAPGSRERIILSGRYLAVSSIGNERGYGNNPVIGIKTEKGGEITLRLGEAIETEESFGWISIFNPNPFTINVTIIGGTGRYYTTVDRLTPRVVAAVLELRDLSFASEDDMGVYLYKSTLGFPVGVSGFKSLQLADSLDRYPRGLMIWKSHDSGVASLDGSVAFLTDVISQDASNPEDFLSYHREHTDSGSFEVNSTWVRYLLNASDHSIMQFAAQSRSDGVVESNVIGDPRIHAIIGFTDQPAL